MPTTNSVSALSNTFALGMEDVLQHWPTWLEDDHESSLRWEAMLHDSGPRSQDLSIFDKHTDLNEKDTALSFSSEPLNRLHPSEPSRMRSLSHIWACGITDCSQKFPLRKTLKRHISSVHAIQKFFACSRCFKTFTRRDIRDRHQREKHEKVEPVECMRCGKLVKDRSLDEHLKSRACIRHISNIERQSNRTTSSAEDHTAMLTAIFEQTEEDNRFFESFNAGSVYNALSASSFLSYKATQGLKTSGSDSRVLLAERDKEAEFFHLRGLTIRSIVRSLATGPFDDELDGAIRAFALTDQMACPEDAKTHEPVLQWLDTERCHRLQQVLSILRAALDQWTPVSTIMQNVLASNNLKKGKAIIRSSTCRLQHLLEPRNLKIDVLNVPPISPTPSCTGLTSTKSATVNSHSSNDNSKSLTAMSKRKRDSITPANIRPNKTKICPVEGCGISVVQRGLPRHLRQVHDQGEVYQCDDCEKTFLRKDSFDRHRYDTHGEGSKKIKCVNCGKSICRRAMEDHVRRRICQTTTLKNQSLAQDAG